MQGRAWAEKAYLTLKHAMKNVAEAKSSYVWLPSCDTVKPPNSNKSQKQRGSG
jgi:hypothetical protein